MTWVAVFLACVLAWISGNIAATDTTGAAILGVVVAAALVAAVVSDD